MVAVESGRGNAEAQSAAQGVRRDFGDVDGQLMVGVGGSLKPDDAPIGGVVASERVHLVRGAEHGDEGLSPRPKGEEADPDLVQIVRKVARDEVRPVRIREPRSDRLPARGGEA